MQDSERQATKQMMKMIYDYCRMREKHEDTDERDWEMSKDLLMLRKEIFELAEDSGFNINFVYYLMEDEWGKELRR